MRVNELVHVQFHNSYTCNLFELPIFEKKWKTLPAGSK